MDEEMKRPGAMAELELFQRRLDERHDRTPWLLQHQLQWRHTREILFSWDRNPISNFSILFTNTIFFTAKIYKEININININRSTSRH